ncbi:MAG: altronate dehydratase family protein [Anaerolineaceae bacterium]
MAQLSDHFIWVNPELDNVAVAKRNVDAGVLFTFNDQQITLAESVKAGHRIALTNIPQGVAIIQYGQPFAVSRGIKCGEAISEDRIESFHDPILRISRQPGQLPAWQGELPTFDGYVRSDGLIGIRNWVVVIPTSMCSSHEAQQIAFIAENSQLYSRQKYPNIDGVTCIFHTFGCGCMNPAPDESPSQMGEMHTTLEMLHRIMRHPNVGAVLLIELGCEKTNLSQLTQWITGSSTDPKDLSAVIGKPVEFLSIQACGGTQPTIQNGLALLKNLLDIAGRNQREKCPISKLALGLKCGGSDSFSGVTANPALGVASDLLIQAGGYSLISEIPEFFGAEHLFASRAINDQVEQNIFDAIEKYKNYLQTSGGNFEDNPSPGNRAGGLINIAIKALGALAKSGKAPVKGVLDYLQPIWQKPGGGLYLLYGPGYDQISTPALVASGAQLVCFTTGRGTGIGNAIAPVVKISSNPELTKHMGADMDIDAGKVLLGATTIREVGEEIFQKILLVASGSSVKSEDNKHREFAIWSQEKVTL